MNLQAVRRVAAPVLLVVLLGVLAGAVWYNLTAPSPYDYDYSKPPVFKDDAQTNATLEIDTIGSLRFLTAKGEEVDLAKYRGQNVVLVVTRGYQGAAGNKPPGGANYGEVCLYCASQTASLMTNYAEIKKRNAEVLVVYPVPTSAESDRLGTFVQAIAYRGGPAGAPPFPLLLDVELKAVDKLGIRQNLSKPATYILDKEGQSRFAYVGQTIADRPSIKAILAQLDAINAPLAQPSASQP